VSESEKFNYVTELYPLDQTLLKVSHVPMEGDTVFCSRGPVQLLKCLASGGEGYVYLTDTDLVCKIYRKEKLTRSKLEKLQLMVSKRIEYPGICWSVELVYNKTNEFVGFMMPRASGKESQKCLFVKPLLLKHFPHWKKRDTVQLALTILDKIKYLHERNVILGDINPLNILVVSPTEVYFVDTDSYQIEGYPCPVVRSILRLRRFNEKTSLLFCEPLNMNILPLQPCCS